MLTLSLLRHGQSSWDDPDLNDHERPLSKHGRNAAEIISDYIAEHGLVPDYILCSTAVRARETLDVLLSRLGSLQPEIVLEPALYLATPTAMLGIIRETARSVRHLMIIGHNPGLHALALDLTGSGLRRDITSMAVKFPSGALAVLTFEENDWTEIRPAAGRLVQFVATRSVA